jgi:hypothetical protein
VVHCHHVIARSKVADGEDGKHVCKVGVNILNELKKCGRPGWRLKIEPKTSHRIK